MKTVALIVVAVALTGCVFVPKSKETVTVLSRSQGTARPGAVEKQHIAAKVMDRTIEIQTWWSRTCTSDVFEHVEITTDYTLGVETSGELANGLGNIGETRVLAPVAAIGLFFVGAVGVASLPVSSAIVGVKNLSPDRRREDRKVGVQKSACPLQGPSPITVELPSGARIELETGANGKATVEIPADEPPTGRVVVRGERTKVERVYVADRDTCQRMRAAAFAGVSGTLDGARRRVMHDQFPSCEAMTSGQPDPVTERAWLLTYRATMAALDGRCADVRAAAHEVKTIRPVHFETVFVKDRPIAICLEG